MMNYSADVVWAENSMHEEMLETKGTWETMHQNIINWVQQKVDTFELRNLKTLEIGSRYINGTIRDCFTGPYVGIDFIDGLLVDIVMDAHILEFPDASFDVVICTEMLEHDSAFWVTLSEVGRVLRPGGHFLMTTRGNGFMEHSWPYDYWRFMKNSGELIANLASCRLESCDDDPYAPGIFLHGIKNELDDNAT